MTRKNERERKIIYFNLYNLISVVKVRSLCVNHNFSFSFIEPKTRTRNITLGCIPKLTKKTTHKSKCSIRTTLYKFRKNRYYQIITFNYKIKNNNGMIMEMDPYSPSRQKEAFCDFKKFRIRINSK